jgi:hypothetical protein
MSKRLGKNIYIEIFTFYMFMQDFVQNGHFSWPVKKDKKHVPKRLILVLFFSLGRGYLASDAD